MAFFTNYLRQFVDYLTNTDDTDITNNNRRNSSNMADNGEEVSENACVLEQGQITFVNEHFGLIDHILYFEDPSITRFKTDMLVYYLAYKKAGETKIKRVLTQINPKSDCDLENSRMNITGKVSDRKGRIVWVRLEKRAHSNVDIDLNSIHSEFIPVVGDWLDIECLIEDPVLVVEKIGPLESKKITGTIKMFDAVTNIGQINDDIMFDKNESCTPGYIPFPGDVVVAQVIRSDQKDCKWRAQKVLPSEETKNRYIKITNNYLNIDLKGVHFDNIHGILVNNNMKVSLNFIGEQAELQFEIRNISKVTHRIYGVQLRTKESQLLLSTPTFESTQFVFSHKSVTFKFVCTARFMGNTKELLVIEFDKFKVGRWIKIYVGQNIDIVTKQIKDCYRAREKNLTEAARDSFFKMDTELVIGQRPVKPPAFIANKLPMFEIPEYIAKIFFCEMDKNAFVGDVEIKNLAPCLEENLHARNYKDKYHTLLYLEELAIQVNARRYDIEQATFEEIEGFLKLEVHNLAERRPSIVVGDKVVALNSMEPRRFEGFVHKISYKHLYLKFNQQFHSAYNGEQYAVEFHSSRTTFRRYHHAVNLAMENLKSDFLFPASVQQKQPQVWLLEDGENQVKRSIEYSQPKHNIEHSTSRSRNIPGSRRQHDAMGKSTHRNNSIHKPLAGSDAKAAPKILDWFDKTLNKFQKLAVKSILTGEARPSPYLLYGPPGTGKTVTLIETILQINKLLPHSRILVVGPSNSVADLIALRLLDAGHLTPSDLVRLVAYRCVVDKCIPPKLVPFCMTGDLAREGSRESKEYVQNGIRMCVRASDIGRHRIIVATCMIVGVLYTMGFPTGHFTHFIIDEAGQATEPETMIPLLLMDVKSSQTILAGKFALNCIRICLLLNV